MTRWWEKDDQKHRHHPEGSLVPEAGPCPDCGARIVYNGNYFCEHWGDSCTWALSHPAKTMVEQEICDRLGIDYL